MDSDTKEKEMSVTKDNIFNEQKISHSKYSYFFLSEITSKKTCNLKILEQIRNILTKCSTLTEKERLEFCKSERYFMKLYLKEVLSEIRKREEML